MSSRSGGPTISKNLEDKNRIGHHRNAVLAVELLRLREGDPRLKTWSLAAGASIPLELWDSDDTKAALVARRSINGRTAAVNQRRLATAALSTTETLDVELLPGVVGKATIRAFKITLGMIVKSAVAAKQVVGELAHQFDRLDGRVPATTPSLRLRFDSFATYRNCDRSSATAHDVCAKNRDAPPSDAGAT